VNRRVRVGLGWLGVVLGLLLAAVSVVALLIAQDLSEHGWASFRHAAVVPAIALTVGIAAVVAGTLTLRSR
jgi:hypothetical protein